MRRVFGISSLLLFLIALVPAWAGAEEEVALAVMLSSKGEVSVQKKSGEMVKGFFGLPLQAGDQVITGEKSEAEILFETGNWILVGPGSNLRVQGSREEMKTADEIPMGENSFEVVQNFLQLKDSEGTSSLARLRSVSKNEIRVDYPRQTKILGSGVTFRWDAPTNSEELELILYNDEGVHWKTKIKGTSSVEYPADAPALSPGATYSWALETTDPLRVPPLRTQAAFFEVLTEEEAERLEHALAKVEKEEGPTEATYYLVRASLYFNHSLMEEAMVETMKALELDPENPTLNSILARLYGELGRTEDALNTYDRILEKK